MKTPTIEETNYEIIKIVKNNPDFKEIMNITRKETIAEVMKIVDEHKNPYPEDIFLWKNKAKLDFDRGRFNQHCNSIVESMRIDLKQKIQELGDKK